MATALIAAAEETCGEVDSVLPIEVEEEDLEAA